jgi:ADP-ribosyltransferase exoenzyme
MPAVKLPTLPTLPTPGSASGAVAKARAKKGKSKYEHGTVGKKSATGDAACSQAMSDFKTKGSSPAIQATLGKCRAKRHAQNKAKAHEGAGNVAKSQVWAHRASTGKVGARARIARAKQLRAERAAKQAEKLKAAEAVQKAPTATTPHAAPESSAPHAEAIKAVAEAPKPAHVATAVTKARVKATAKAPKEPEADKESIASLKAKAPEPKPVHEPFPATSPHPAPARTADVGGMHAVAVRGMNKTVVHVFSEAHEATAFHEAVKNHAKVTYTSKIVIPAGMKYGELKKYAGEQFPSVPVSYVHHSAASTEAKVAATPPHPVTSSPVGGVTHKQIVAHAKKQGHDPLDAAAYAASKAHLESQASAKAKAKAVAAAVKTAKAKAGKAAESTAHLAVGTPSTPELSGKKPSAFDVAFAAGEKKLQEAKAKAAATTPSSASNPPHAAAAAATATIAHVHAQAAAQSTAHFPASPEGLETVKTLGGSTGAKLVKDTATGKLYVHKTGKNAGHLQEEAHADAAYRALGVPTAASKIYQTASGPVKLAEHHEGTTLGELRQSNPEAAKAAEAELRKHFVADALLGNWDVVGANHDNILVTSAGQVLRIDNGGALRYRAQGGEKGHKFGATVGELESLRNPALNPSAAKVFGGITDAEIKAQIHEVLGRKTALLAALPTELHGVLQKRLSHLKTHAAELDAKAAQQATFDTAHKEGKPIIYTGKGKTPHVLKTAPTETLHPEHVFKAPFANQDLSGMESWGKQHFAGWADSLSAQEGGHLESYTGGGYTSMNAWIREGKWNPEATDTYNQRITKLKAALDRAAVPEHMTSWRGIKDHETLGIADINHLKIGDEIHEAAFASTSLSREKAENFASGGYNPVLLRVHVPKGTRAAYVNAASEHSQHPGERELLISAGSAKYRITKIEAGAGQKSYVSGKAMHIVHVQVLQ